ncbi:MAG: hypothetical protein HQ523_15665 [Lentisphaerae bacterium]|nr:hypothetical protein [Lentisphaerota bacterium]
MPPYFRALSLVVAALALCGCRRHDEALVRLNEENAALDARLARLEQQVEALAHRPAPPPRVPTVPAAPAEAPAIAPPDTSALLARIEALIDARTDAVLSAKVSALVQQAVAQTVGTAEDIEAVMEDVVKEEIAAAEKRKAEADTREREGRRAEWEQRRKERDAERLDELAVTLSMNDWQKEHVSEAQEHTRDELRAKMTEMRDAGHFDMEAFRTTAESIQSNHNVAVAEYLTPEQAELYKAQQGQDLNFFNMTGGRGRRGR